MIPAALMLRRRAAFAMNQIVREIGLGSLGRIYLSDNDDDWSVLSDTQVYCLADGRKVADISTLDDEGTMLEILIPDAYMLVVPSKMREFDPEVFGIQIRVERDWRGDRLYNDIEVTMDTSEAPGLNIPKQPTSRATIAHNAKVIGSIR